MDVTIKGLDEVLASMRRVSTRYPQQLPDIHDKVARPLATAAERRVPVRSGRLKGTIRPVGLKGAAEVSAGHGIAYAGVIHNGWPGHNIEAQPFLSDALDDTGDAAVDVYFHEVERFLDRVW